MSSNAVAAQSLYKKYKKHTILNDFNLTVSEGEVHALVGPIGSGKTTVLNILAGTVSPSYGTAKIFNYRVGSMEARKVLGYVPEKPSFYPAMTVLDYLVFMGMLSGVNQLEAIARAIALLKKTDLNTFKDKNPNDLTQGMKTKIALIQALLSRPRLLLLDQPVEGMDQAGKSSILQLVSELAVAEGITVIISSSRWNDISPISEKMTLMHEGKVLLSGDERAIEELFGLGVFSFQTSDNKRLISILQRLPYLKHIIITEKDLITVMTDESERLRKDLPGIIFKLELELTYFQQEEVTSEKLPYYLSMIQGD